MKGLPLKNKRDELNTYYLISDILLALVDLLKKLILRHVILHEPSENKVAKKLSITIL